MRVGVLVSGRGSNLRALAAAEGVAYELAVVISNVEDAPALAFAQARGIPTAVVSHRGWPQDAPGGPRAAFERALTARLRDAGVEQVVLAGFMRVLSPEFVGAWPGRIVNIHPSLLPAFPGLHAQAQALAAGVRVAGCTVHLVDEGTDTGPILSQAAVPVRWDDTETTLSERILVQEHRLLPRVLDALARGQLQVQWGPEGRRVVGELEPQ